MKKEQDYEAFRDKMERAVTDYYGEDYDVSIKRVTKLNGVILYGLNILKKNTGICPTIYLETFFEKYIDGIAFSTLFSEIVDIYEEYKKTEVLSVDFFSDYEKVKDKLSVKLINAKLNKELLEDVPHKRFSDLAIVCMVEMRTSREQVGSVLIHNNHICMWGVRENRLIEDALKNAMLIAAPRINKLSDVVLSMYNNCKDESRKEMFKDGIEKLRHEPNNMFILSNTSQNCGASVIAYPNLLEGIGDSLDSDYYVLPSSIHEVIILPKAICAEEGNINHMIKPVLFTE